MEPVSSALSVALILQTACSEFVKGTTGEAGKQLTAAAIAKVKQLYQLIKARLGNDPKAREAIAAIEAGRSTDLKALEHPLSLEMANDPEFAQQVRQLAQQIINIDSVEGRNVQNIYGGEAFQVNDPNAPVIQGGSGHSISITYNNNSANP